MDKFLDALFHDPILLVAAAVLLATTAILIWALIAWRKNGLPVDEMLPDDDQNPPQDTQAENAGLIEARLHEILSELGGISGRMQALEKKASETKQFDQTIPVPSAPLSNVEIERIAKRLESKIEALAAEKSQLPSDSITRIETRLEGIHKLLILLTESGGSPAEK